MGTHTYPVTRHLTLLQQMLVEVGAFYRLANPTKSVMQFLPIIKTTAAISNPVTEIRSLMKIYHRLLIRSFKLTDGTLEDCLIVFT